MEESEGRDHRKIRQDDREISLIRSYGKTQLTSTGPLRGGGGGGVDVTYHYRNFHAHRSIRI